MDSPFIKYVTVTSEITVMRINVYFSRDAN